MVRKWVRMFNEGRENVHNEARSGRSSLVNDDLVCKINENCVTTDFPQFLICPCTFHRFQGMYDIVNSHLGYRCYKAYLRKSWQYCVFERAKD